MADALSRKAELAAVTQRTEHLCLFREGINNDPQAKNLLGKEGKTRRFWLDDGLIRTLGGTLYVPKWGGLRFTIMKECHDSLWAGPHSPDRPYINVHYVRRPSMVDLHY